jgi:SPP1 family predicted phage head-tail adaptor
MINAGDLNERITLQKPTITRGTDGSETITYATEKTIRAERMKRSGKEFYAAQKVNAEVTELFKTWYRSGMDNRWRVVYGNRTLEIVDIDDLGKRDGEMILRCKEVI